MAKHKWIGKIHMKRGAMTQQAKAMAFAEEHKGDSGTTGKRARLALTLRRVARKHKKGK